MSFCHPAAQMPCGSTVIGYPGYLRRARKGLRNYHSAPKPVPVPDLAWYSYTDFATGSAARRTGRCGWPRKTGTFHGPGCRADRVLHCRVFLHAALSELLPEGENLPSGPGAVLSNSCHCLFSQGVRFQPVVCQPLFHHLLYGIGFSSSVSSRIAAVSRSRERASMAMACRTSSISTPIPRSLISWSRWYSSQMVSGTGKLESLFLYLHFRLHIPEVICLEPFPFLRVMLRQVPHPASVCFGRSAGDTEIADQVFALRQLLLLQPQHYAHAFQERKAQCGGPHHRAAPGCRSQIVASRVADNRERQIRSNCELYDHFSTVSSSNASRISSGVSPRRQDRPPAQPHHRQNMRQAGFQNLRSRSIGTPAFRKIHIAVRFQILSYRFQNSSSPFTAQRAAGE